MRKFSQIVGWHVLFVFLSPLLLISSVSSVICGFEFSAYCTAQSPDSEDVKGKVASISHLSGRRGLVYKIEYKDEQGCKQVFHTAEKDYFRNKRVGDSVTFKVNDGEIIVPDCSDVVFFLLCSAFALIVFLLSATAGLLLRNYQNEVHKGKERVILYVGKLLILCGSAFAFYMAAGWVRDDFFPKDGRVEVVRILSINMGRQGCALTVKTVDGREGVLTPLTSLPIPILSTGQDVEVFFQENGTPRLATKEISVMFFACSSFLLFVSVSAFFRRRKSYKPSVLPEDYVELPPFFPYKG